MTFNWTNIKKIYNIVIPLDFSSIFVSSIIMIFIVFELNSNLNIYFIAIILKIFTVKDVRIIIICINIAYIIKWSLNFVAYQILLYLYDF